MKKLLMLLSMIAVAASSFAFVSQSNWRWRNDNGSQTSATWAAAQNSVATISNTTGRIRLRMAFYNQNTGGSDVNTSYLKYSADFGYTWDSVSTYAGNKAFVLAGTSAYLADGAITTQQLTAESGAVFQPGAVIVSSNTLGANLVAGHGQTEYEWVLKTTSNLKPNTTYLFKLAPLNGGAELLRGAAELVTSAYCTGVVPVTINGTISGVCKVVYNGKTYMAPSTIVRDTIKTAKGCDSIYNVKLIKITTPKPIIKTVSASGTCFVNYKGKNYDVTTTVRDTVKAVSGCDSIYNVGNLKVTYLAKKTDAHLLKRFTAVTYHGVLFTTGDLIVRDTLKSVRGCDSLISIDTFRLAKGSDIEQSMTNAERAQLKSATGISTVRASYYNQMFTRYKAGTWTGGDVASSLALPDGRSFWLFGDSFVDTVYADRSRPFRSFIHNSAVATTPAGGFETFYNGTAASPKPLFDSVAPYLFWPACAFVNGAQDKVYTMMITVKITGGGGFGFETVGNAVGELSYPDLKPLRQFTFTNSPTVDWSSATFAENGYIYLYGAETASNNKFVHVCRTAAATPFATVEYYDGTNWVTDPTQSARLLSGVSEQYSVFKHKGKYYLLSQESTYLSADIYLWDAASPVGPFTNKRKIYRTPESKGNIITYNATAHPQFIVDDMLLVGYCNNAFGGNDIWTNADNYRPYFIWVNNWQ